MHLGAGEMHHVGKGFPCAVNAESGCSALGRQINIVQSVSARLQSQFSKCLVFSCRRIMITTQKYVFTQLGALLTDNFVQ